ncbi:type II toxin-antitoxin system RelE/ParE family toxin [Ralstonia psammae]|uniref:type II toxin-antitoxin system RelE/ParE family toxin n=1 Tax=Ralstonia psammae TaxID=3058598 RepID=UPI00292F09FE|nr:type II toxin-antitoxin system RelE/ParE family toxin [Ralstonia sp. LMG 19083]
MPDSLLLSGTVSWCRVRRRKSPLLDGTNSGVGSAAAYVVQDLARAPGAVLASPRIGEQLDEFESHEVRRIIVGQYEMRYEVREGVLYILRFWHTREGR